MRTWQIEEGVEDVHPHVIQRKELAGVQLTNFMSETNIIAELIVSTSFTCKPYMSTAWI